MNRLMPRLAIFGLLGALLWIAWCILVITTLVPAILLHITIWDWLMAWVLCILPVLVLAIIAALRVRAQG